MMCRPLACVINRNFVWQDRVEDQMSDYEIIDTKLARETKAGSVLPLCLYADL